MSATYASVARCAECGWVSHETSEATGQFLAVAHVAFRHPSTYESVIGRPSDQFTVGLSKAEKTAYVLAVEAGML